MPEWLGAIMAWTDKSQSTAEWQEEATFYADLAERSVGEARFWLVEGRTDRARLLLERSAQASADSIACTVFADTACGRMRPMDGAVALAMSVGEMNLRERTLARESVDRLIRVAAEAAEARRRSGDVVLDW